jgi:quercetin dioxygenase-like cupin family protein
MTAPSRDASNLLRVAGRGTQAHIRRFSTWVQVSGDHTDGSVAVMEHELEQGTLAMPLHKHQASEVLHVLSGMLTVQIDASVHQLRSNSSIVIPPNRMHTFWVGPDEPAPARFMSIVSPAGMEKYYEEVSKHVPRRGAPEMEGVLAAGERHGVQVDLDSIYDLVEKHTIQLS